MSVDRAPKIIRDRAGADRVVAYLQFRVAGMLIRDRAWSILYGNDERHATN